MRTAHTLHVGFEVSCDLQVGCVAQPRTRLVEYIGYGLCDNAYRIFACGLDVGEGLRF